MQNLRANITFYRGKTVQRHHHHEGKRSHKTRLGPGEETRAVLGRETTQDGWTHRSHLFSKLKVRWGGLTPGGKDSTHGK